MRNQNTNLKYKIRIFSEFIPPAVGGYRKVHPLQGSHERVSSDLMEGKHYHTNKPTLTDDFFRFITGENSRNASHKGGALK